MDAKQYCEEHWIDRKVWTHLTWPKHQERLKLCAEKMIGEKFIDVGCGCGHSTNIMQGFKMGVWSGLDFSKRAIEMAKEFFPNIPFYYAPDYEMKSLVGEFDSVVCSEVIEHILDDKSFVDKLLEITKNILVLTTPNIRVSDPGHLRIYTEELLHQLCKSYKYEIISHGNFFYVIIKK